MDLWYLHIMQPFDLILYILTEFAIKEKITFVMILIDIICGIFEKNLKLIKKLDHHISNLREK